MTDVLTTAAFLALVNSSLLMPPKKYEHMPGPAYTIDMVPAKYLDLACLPNKPTRAGKVRTGCVTKLRGVYTMHLDDRLTGEALRRVKLHEGAHIKGWKHP